MKRITKIAYAILVLLTFGCSALLPSMHAVTPAPDGGYPGGNTAEGQNALLSLTTGGFNTAVGFLSLKSNSINNLNTAVGAAALLANTADQNTAIGAGALVSNTAGTQNTANGALALFHNTVGPGNTANGEFALFNNMAGPLNTAVGFNALPGNTTGGSNVALGYGAGGNVTTASSVICIGALVPGANVNNTCFIGNIRGVTTQNTDAIPVLIDSNRQLGTASSSRRYKTDIKPMDKASESILALKPVSFRYKVHRDTTPQFGLIAEEVAEVDPDLVIYDADGKPYTVRYEAVNAMLLNEFLKEHKTVQEQGATMTQQGKDFEAAIARQQKQIEALTATVKEQAAQIQKVSAQLEVSKAAPQTVLNNQ